MIKLRYCFACLLCNLHYFDECNSCERTNRSLGGERARCNLILIQHGSKESRVENGTQLGRSRRGRVSRKSCALISETNDHLAQRGVRLTIVKKVLATSGVKWPMGGVLFVRLTVTTIRADGPTLRPSSSRFHESWKLECHCDSCRHTRT